MSNVGATQKVTLRRLMGTRLFALGVADYLKGHPMRDADDMRDMWTRDYFAQNAQYAYERGRLFAAYCMGRQGEVPALKGRNRRITMPSLYLMSEAVRAGLIS